MQTRGSGMEKLLHHARILQRLDTLLTSALEPGLSAHCQVSEFRDHCLLIACSNASFATRLRMISRQLIDSLNEEGKFTVEQLEIRVMPVNRPKPETPEKGSLSSAAMRALERFAADSCDADIQTIFEQIKARRGR